MTEQLKLSKIPDAEIGQRIKAVVYFFVHVYCFAYVSGQTFRNIITTPTTELKELWQELFHALNAWLQPLFSDAQIATKQQSNLQLNGKALIAPSLSEVYLSEKGLLLPVVPTPKKRSKPKGFK